MVIVTPHAMACMVRGIYDTNKGQPSRPYGLGLSGGVLRCPNLLRTFRLLMSFSFVLMCSHLPTHMFRRHFISFVYICCLHFLVMWLWIVRLFVLVIRTQLVFLPWETLTWAWTNNHLFIHPHCVCCVLSQVSHTTPIHHSSWLAICMYML